MAKKSYNDQNISALKGADRVRYRPGVMFGSDDLDGCFHSFFEILSNSVDEAREGYGKEIIVTAYSDHTLQVEDFGRGIPLGWNEKEGRYNWDLIYCELYAGGKYDNNADDAAYSFSLGLNGLGACATQCCSEFMDVTAYYGSTVSRISFKKGEAASELETAELSKKEKRYGTIQKWRPDLEVFTDINIPKERLRDCLHRQSIVNGGIKFVFNWQTEDGSFETEEFINENGIEDYIRQVVGENPLIEPVKWSFETKGRDRDDREDYRLKVDMVFSASLKNQLLEYYHNSSWLEHGGSPAEAVKSAFTSALDKQLKLKGKYNKNESKLKFEDIADCLVFVSSSFSTKTSYENQTKKSITNSFITRAMTDFLKQHLEYYFNENPHDGDKLLSQVLINKRAREKANEIKTNVKAALAAQQDNAAGRVEKFVGCRSRDPERRELYIVEGDSAMTSCKLGRDAEFQAIIPVRGKTLNCLKSTYDKILKNDIITDLIKVIGCGAEIPVKKGTESVFSLEALRWSKIIICTDADEDGFQIRALILTMFYRLLPTLIEAGRVFIAESPLYEITVKDEIFFAYDEKEKEEILSKIDTKKYTLQRSKGLGENEPDMMWQTTMNPATRRLIRVSKADAEETARIFDTLLGDDLPARKRFITEHSGIYIKDADLA